MQIFLNTLRNKLYLSHYDEFNLINLLKNLITQQPHVKPGCNNTKPSALTLIIR